MSSLGASRQDKGQASSSNYTTPTKKATFQAEAGPSRPAGSSPAYVTNLRRHSLYGTEDRVILDPGSRLWKVGFSGEPRPRAVFQASPGFEGEQEMWDLDMEKVQGAQGARDEAERLVAARIRRRLQEVYTKHLLTDAKSRKVIIVESAFLPLAVKEQITRTLFQTMRVPSVSFVPSHVLAITATGRPTGLVLDCGFLETTIMPVFASRPMYSNIGSTILAGRALSKRLRALLLNFSTYTAPPPAIGSSSPAPQRVPEELLSDQVVEMVLTQGCFVGSAMVDVAPEDAPPSVPGSSRTRRPSLGQGTSTENERVPYAPGEAPEPQEPAIYDEAADEPIMASLQRRYEKSSTASSTVFKIHPGFDSPPAMSFGSLLVPGWVRERAAEILFEESAGEEASLPELVLDALLKLPVDLRVPMASSLLVCGGTASLAGFIPRLRVAVLQGLFPPTASSTPPSRPVALPSEGSVSAADIKESNSYWRSAQDEPYKAIYPLASKLSILNDPQPLDSEGTSSGGKAPCWTPSLMAWVGGSLAGSLKTGGAEVLREYFDEAVAEVNVKMQAASASDDVDMDGVQLPQGRKGFRVGRVLPDWSRVAVA